MTTYIALHEIIAAISAVAVAYRRRRRFSLTPSRHYADTDTRPTRDGRFRGYLLLAGDGVPPTTGFDIISVAAGRDAPSFTCLLATYPLLRQNASMLTAEYACHFSNIL